MISLVRNLLEHAKDDGVLVPSADMAGGELVGLSHAVAVCLEKGWLRERWDHDDGTLVGYELTGEGADALLREEKDE